MKIKTQLFNTIILSFALLCGPLVAHAKTFKNAYISFEILDNWDCKAQAPEWVCRSNDPIESKEAVIILTAKEKGPTDTFQIYEAHMNSSQTNTSKKGVTLVSTVVYKAQTNRYNDQPWLDGLHRDGQVKNYFTRYLATVKDQIAILVTFSAHNKYYSKYSATFIDTIKSLRIIAPKDLLTRPEGNRTGESFGNNNMQAGIGVMADDPETQSQKGSNNEKYLGFGILIAAILGYIGYRIYAKKNQI